LTKQLLAKQETELLHEELTSARNSLKESEERLRKAHEQIEREKRKQKEKEYKELQELRNRYAAGLFKTGVSSTRDCDRAWSSFFFISSSF